MAPSQDITISSNFERVLYWACSDTQKIRQWMDELKNTGKFQVDVQTLEKLGSVFTSSKATDIDIRDIQIEIWSKHGKIIDPHTATGLAPYRKQTPQIPTV